MNIWWRNPFTFPNRLLEGLALHLPAKGEHFSKRDQESWLELAKLILEDTWGKESQSSTEAQPFPPAGR